MQLWNVSLLHLIVTIYHLKWKEWDIMCIKRDVTLWLWKVFKNPNVRTEQNHSPVLANTQVLKQVTLIQPWLITRKL